jgi:hypothetical protein
MLSREQFLKDGDLKRDTVSVEGLGDVRMRELSVGERMRYTALYEGHADRDTLVSLALVAASLCNPDDSSMFAASEVDDAVEMLKGKAQRTIEALQGAFLRMSGLSHEAVSEAVGNSTEIPSDGGSFA